MNRVQALCGKTPQLDSRESTACKIDTMSNLIATALGASSFRGSHHNSDLKF